MDRYKYSIYQHVSDPFLRLITTLDSSSTRFHACERFNRCSYVEVENNAGYTNATSAMGKRVVYVNPVTMGADDWSSYLEDTKHRLLDGDEVNNLVCFSSLTPFLVPDMPKPAGPTVATLNAARVAEFCQTLQANDHNPQYPRPTFMWT